MRVYVGLPIDTSRPEHSPAEQIQEVTDLIVAALGNEVVIFNPLQAYCNVGPHTKNVWDMHYVVDVNREALIHADLAVFVWNGSPSYGIVYEMEEFQKLGRPFAVWNRTGRGLGLYLRWRLVLSEGVCVTNGADLISWLRGRLKENDVFARTSSEHASPHQTESPPCRGDDQLSSPESAPVA